MTGLFPILILFAFFFSGMCAGRFKTVRRSRLVSYGSYLILPAMLLVMGYRIGVTTESIHELARTGITAVIFAAATVTGTFIFTGTLCLLDHRGSTNRGAPEPGKKDGWSGAVFLLLMVVAGFLAGSILPESRFSGDSLITWLLRLLLFSIGIDMVKSGVSFSDALKDRNTVLLPLLTVMGSLAGGLGAALFLGMNAWKGLSIASGFGWYTLSGVLITELGDPLLGSTAFLTNMFREAMAIVIIPFLGRTGFARSAVGIAGATSMDVTLPLIEKAGGPNMVPLSISHGAFISLTVPLLVPLFYQAG